MVCGPFWFSIFVQPKPRQRLMGPNPTFLNVPINDKPSLTNGYQTLAFNSSAGFQNATNNQSKQEPTACYPREQRRCNKVDFFLPVGGRSGQGKSLLPATHGRRRGSPPPATYGRRGGVDIAKMFHRTILQCSLPRFFPSKYIVLVFHLYI